MKENEVKIDSKVVYGDDQEFHIANELLHKILPIVRGYSDEVIFNSFMQVCCKLAHIHKMNADTFGEFAKKAFLVSEIDLNSREGK